MSSRNTVVRSLHDLGAATWSALTGAIVVLGAQQGEQQRPAQILAGIGGTLTRRAQA